MSSSYSKFGQLPSNLSSLKCERSRETILFVIITSQEKCCCVESPDEMFDDLCLYNFTTSADEQADYFLFAAPTTSYDATELVQSADCVLRAIAFVSGQ
jgi:hypothetical protein